MIEGFRRVCVCILVFILFSIICSGVTLGLGIWL